MKYKAIIFDMDGTILNSESIWRAATHHVIQKNGVTISPEQTYELNERLIGAGLAQACATIKEVMDIPGSVDDLIAEKIKTANALYEKQICFIDGFEPFHHRATSQFNLKTALATNAENSTVQATNKTLDLARFFGNHIYDISHVNNRAKPDPALYKHTASMLGIDPRDCIAIEDSARGIQAAQSAGMLCIGFHGVNDPSQTTNANIRVGNYNDIDLAKLLEK